MFRLDGKVAFVTGASRGLGFAIAQALATQGAAVVLNGRDAAALQQRAQVIRASGGVAHVAAFDVTNAQAAVHEVARIVAEFGRIDILVNNAGIQHRSALVDFKDEDFARVIDVNLTALWRLCREVAKGMIANRSGRIILLGSTSAQLSRPRISAYTASKGAVTALGRQLAAELAPHNITVNVIQPGFFGTEMNTDLVNDAKFSAWVASRTPLGRWGEPREVGAVAAFLASDEASYVTGATVAVDGGLAAAM